MYYANIITWTSSPLVERLVVRRMFNNIKTNIPSRNPDSKPRNSEVVIYKRLRPSPTRYTATTSGLVKS